MQMIKQKNGVDCILACLAMVDDVQLDTLHRQARDVCGGPWFVGLTHQERNHQVDMLCQVRAPWASNLIKITRNKCILGDFKRSPGRLRGRGIITVIFYNFILGATGHAIAFENGVIHEPTEGKRWGSWKKYKKSVEWMSGMDLYVAGVSRKPVTRRSLTY